jgi:glycine oxidase
VHSAHPHAAKKNWDVLIIGGGIIGVSLALALRRRGASVLVIERGQPGHEASSAAGGMLVEYGEETPPALQALALASTRLYPEFAHEIEVESGVKVDLRDHGAIVFPENAHGAGPQGRTSFMSREQLSRLEPALASAGRPAVFVKERSVDPRALTAAAIKAARHRGVDFSSGDPVVKVDLSEGRTCGVTTSKTTFLGEKVVNCAGAWSSMIPPFHLPTRPVKGQMLCLAMEPRELVKHVIRSPEVYLIPRSDGRLLAGATVEEAGFDKRTDAATMQRFHHAALAMVPALRDARLLEDWAGLRPGTPDALPILGATETPGCYAATGHFRDGILLAPVTAEVMTAILENRNPEYDLSPFSPTRFALA